MKGIFALLVCISALNASYVYKDEFIKNPDFNEQINIIGSELYQKTGISFYVVALEKLGTKPLVVLEKEIAKELKAPFILLSLSRDDQQVNILASQKLYQRFDKEQVLSPFAWRGSIIPILTSKIKEDPNRKYAAGLFNGYADVAEQVASSYDITLESAVGSGNQNFVNILRLFVYGSIFLVIGTFMYRRFFRRKTNV